MPGDRSRIIVLFTLNGAALGVLLAMFFCTSSNGDYGQTNIRESLPLTVFLASVGLFIGILISKLSESTGPFVSVGTVLLTCLIGGAMGWLYGSDAQARHVSTISPGRATAEGCLVGVGIGIWILSHRWLSGPIDRLNRLLSPIATKLVIIACVVIAGIIGIELKGYYKGLNVLAVCAALSLFGSLTLQNRFLLFLSLGVGLSYVMLSAVTISN